MISKSNISILSSCFFYQPIVKSVINELNLHPKRNRFAKFQANLAYSFRDRVMSA